MASVLAVLNHRVLHAATWLPHFELHKRLSVLRPNTLHIPYSKPRDPMFFRID